MKSQNIKVLSVVVALAAIAIIVPNTNSFIILLTTRALAFSILVMSVDVLLGYTGLASLGQAAYLGVGAYLTAILATRYQFGLGYDFWIVALLGICFGAALAAVFGLLAIRATGVYFLMITLALGQCAWGLAYRWNSLTGGDNGINVASRPAPFGLSLTFSRPFYFFVLIVFLIAVAAMTIFIRSPFGASLKGTRDQPRRMTALGYNVWLIRFLAFLFSGFWSGVAGILFCYYNQFVSPNVLALSSSAEALLMVISGGTGTLLGPIAGAALVVVMKNVASAYIERWNFVLGAIFVAIVIFMPEGLVPGSVRLWRWAWSRLRGPRVAAALRTGGGRAG